MTTSPSTTAGKTSRPDVRRGAGGRRPRGQDGHHRHCAIFCCPCAGTIGNSSSHITYQAARARVSHTREMGRIEEGIIIAASRRGGAHQSEGQGREFPIPRLPPWSGDEAPAKDQESEKRQ